MSLSAAEQYMLELINRARLNPAAEASRFNLDLNAGLPAGTIDTTAKQVLAPNSNLEEAATDHSLWMLETDTFSHNGINDTDAGTRMATHGYDFKGQWIWRENLAWVGSTGAMDSAQAIDQHHEGLYRSEHHRENTFDSGVREIGIGQMQGKFTYQGTTYNSSMLTEKFAATGTDVFVTGVAYRDYSEDQFYSIGEGLGDIGFAVRGSQIASEQTQTGTAGGYALKVVPSSEVIIDVTNGSKVLAQVQVDTTDGNTKLDLEIGSDDEKVLLLSSSSKLLGGIHNARLLGSDDLSLTGTSSRDQMIGNDADNMIDGGRGRDNIWGGDGQDYILGGSARDKIWGGNGSDKIDGGGGRDVLFGGKQHDEISGGNGRDRLVGGGGNDDLYGGNNNDKLIGKGGSDALFGGNDDDWLDGGGGRDVMTGGDGRDTFVFRKGHDTITDFEDNTDLILVRAKLVGDADLSDIIETAQVQAGDTMLDFGYGHTLTILGVDDPDILVNHLSFL